MNNFIVLDKIDSSFRELTDRLFFTDRTDLDLSEYKNLFVQKNEHQEYLWDRFSRSSEIYWNESFWTDRFALLLSLESKKIVQEVESYLVTRFLRLINNHSDPNPSTHNEYIQFLAWVKSKHLRKDNLMEIRNLLLNLPNSMQINKVIAITKQLIPSVFPSLDDYVMSVSQKLTLSARSYDVLKELEKQGFAIDKKAIVKTAKDILMKKMSTRRSRRTFFTVLNDPSILSQLKEEYQSSKHRNRLLAFIEACDYKELEEFHLRNMKNLIALDSSIADDLLVSYANKLYGRSFGNKKVNVVRLTRACNVISSFSPKKVLLYLSSTNQMSDIKNFVSAFPDLKSLAVFA